MSKVLEINENNFNETIKGVSFVAFSAPWCGPCRMMAPVLEKLANEIPNVTFGKVNVDEDADLASKYAVRAVPTMIIFKDGKVVDTLVGAVSEAKIREAIKV